MIKITITKTTPVRLFDRMPLPKAANSVILNRKTSGLIRRNSTLNKYITNPFVRKITKIA